MRHECARMFYNFHARYSDWYDVNGTGEREQVGGRPLGVML